MKKVVEFTQDMKRVWTVTRKPTKKEYWTTLKIVALGFLIIGFVGFLVELLWRLLLMKLFV